jgi:hypothetical protein
MNTGRASLLACLCVLSGVAVACSSKRAGPCGESMGDGQFRFCGTDQDYQCVCGTGRCAVEDATDCPETGLRYTDGAGECVPPADRDGASVVPSTGPSAACTPPADADADGDGDGDGDGDADADADDAADADGDGDDDGEAEGFEAYMEMPTVLGSVPRADPRLVMLDDSSPIVMTSDPWTRGVYAPSANIYVQELDWAAGLVGSEASLDVAAGVGDAQIQGTPSWTACTSSSGHPSAIFGHWVMTDPAGGALFYHPVLTWVERDDSEAILLFDVTDDIIETIPPSARAFRIVHDAGQPCWIAWLESDGASPSTLRVRARTIRGPGDAGPVQDVLVEDTDWRFGSALLFLPDDPPSTEDELDFMASGDGTGGLIAAIPVRQRLGPAFDWALWGQRLAVGGTAQWGDPADNALAAFPDSTAPYCTDGPCEGIELPSANAVAVAGSFVHFLVVVVDFDDDPVADPIPVRRLVDISRFLTDAGSPEAQLISAVPDLLRGPMLAAGPSSTGTLFGAVMNWDGLAAGTAMETYLVQLPATAVSTAATFVDGLFPAGVHEAVEDRWLLSFAAYDAAAIVQRLLRFDATGVADPWWPAGGLLASAGATGIDPEGVQGLAPLPVPATETDGGALVAWTEQVSRLSYVARVRAPW